MTMSFRTVKTAVQAILAAKASTGLYRVLGYDSDAIDSEYLKNANRLIQVYSKSGDFVKGASGYAGSITHDPVINIDLTVATSALVDLSALTDPNATAGEIAAALAAEQNASGLADQDMDEFVDFVYQELMSPINIYMGLAKGTVSNRWITRWEKGKSMAMGGSVIMTATLDLSYRTNENLVGNTPVTPTADEAVRAEIKTTTSEDSDPEGGAGVLGGG